eukprot:TRINITY_DN3013_c1_g1_i1.p1 TRINITY_DN3013_c1_g1~~TRINITY_DN3013_c1_g1_i1.p1  ORF type:complete len:1860 (-),score=323.35 TRINITY_DN3013_c1_g1_i1:1157-6736(-)
MVSLRRKNLREKDPHEYVGDLYDDLDDVIGYHKDDDSKKRNATTGSKQPKNNDLYSESEDEFDIDEWDSEDEFRVSRSNRLKESRSRSRRNNDMYHDHEEYSSDDEFFDSLDLQRPVREAPVYTGPKVETFIAHTFLTNDQIHQINMKYNTNYESNVNDKSLPLFLVKWVGKSYMHCCWVSQFAIMDIPSINTRIRRYLHGTESYSISFEVFFENFDNISEFLNSDFVQPEKIIDVRLKKTAITPPPRTNFGLPAFSENLETIDMNEDSFLPANILNGLPDEIKDAQMADITKLLDDDIDGKQFLVKWTSLPYEQCTWEDIDMIEDVQLIHDFYERSKPKLPLGFMDRLAQMPKPIDSYVFQEGKFKEVTDEEFNGNYPRDYQWTGINWMLSNFFANKPCILGDEMGLGKTVQTICFLNILRKHFQQLEDTMAPILVVVPLSLLTNWLEEFKVWAPELNVIVFHGNQTGRDILKAKEFNYYEPFVNRMMDNLELDLLYATEDVKSNWQHQQYYLRRTLLKQSKFDVLITSYDTIQTEYDSLSELEYSIMICDEAHKLKNSETKIYNNLFGFDRIYTLLLTGTPIQNNLIELYNLLFFLAPGKFKDLDKFLAKNDPTYVYEDEELSASEISRRQKNLAKVLDAYMLRRLKIQVEKTLPTKSEYLVRIPLTDQQSQVYKSFLSKHFAEIATKFENVGANQPVDFSGSNFMYIVSSLRRICNHPYLLGEEEYFSGDSSSLVDGSGKLQFLKFLLAECQRNSEKILIFSQNYGTLDMLELFLAQLQIQYERLDGRKRSMERKLSIDRFVSDPERYVMLISTKAGGLGLNLTVANTVVLFDSDFNPQNDLQAMARVHRIGQKNQVRIFRLMSNLTIEEQLIRRSLTKLELEKDLASGENKQFNQKELAETGLDLLIKYGILCLTDESNEFGNSSGIFEQFNNEAVFNDFILNQEQVIYRSGSVERLNYQTYENNFVRLLAKVRARWKNAENTAANGIKSETANSLDVDGLDVESMDVKDVKQEIVPKEETDEAKADEAKANEAENVKVEDDENAVEDEKDLAQVLDSWNSEELWKLEFEKEYKDFMSGGRLSHMKKMYRLREKRHEDHFFVSLEAEEVVDRRSESRMERNRRKKEKEKEARMLKEKAKDARLGLVDLETTDVDNWFKVGARMRKKEDIHQHYILKELRKLQLQVRGQSKTERKLHSKRKRISHVKEGEGSTDEEAQNVQNENGWTSPKRDLFFKNLLMFGERFSEFKASFLENLDLNDIKVVCDNIKALMEYYDLFDSQKEKAKEETTQEPIEKTDEKEKEEAKNEEIIVKPKKTRPRLADEVLSDSSFLRKLRVGSKAYSLRIKHLNSLNKHIRASAKQYCDQTMSNDEIIKVLIERLELPYPFDDKYVKSLDKKTSKMIPGGPFDDENGSNGWTYDCDKRLLVGIFNYGYDHYEEILYSEILGFDQNMLAANEEKLYKLFCERRSKYQEKLAESLASSGSADVKKDAIANLQKFEKYINGLTNNQQSEDELKLAAKARLYEEVHSRALSLLSALYLTEERMTDAKEMKNWTENHISTLIDYIGEFGFQKNTIKHYPVIPPFEQPTFDWNKCNLNFPTFELEHAYALLLNVSEIHRQIKEQEKRKILIVQLPKILQKTAFIHSLNEAIRFSKAIALSRLVFSEQLSQLSHTFWRRVSIQFSDNSVNYNLPKWWSPAMISDKVPMKLVAESDIRLISQFHNCPAIADWALFAAVAKYGLPTTIKIAEQYIQDPTLPFYYIINRVRKGKSISEQCLHQDVAVYAQEIKNIQITARISAIVKSFTKFHQFEMNVGIIPACFKSIIKSKKKKVKKNSKSDQKAPPSKESQPKKKEPQ